MNVAPDLNSIIRIVRSMALAKTRGVFTPGAQRLPESIPGAVRHELARDAALFFGLPEQDAAKLETLPDYEAWAEYIHASATARGWWSFTFFTSGSTGQPCPHVYSLEELEEEARMLKALFTERTRVVSVMPVHHVFGFAFALMLPRLLNIPVKEMPPLPSADFFRELRPGDLVLAFPVFWRSFLEICSGPHALACPPDIHGVTSAAPCPPEVIEGLLAVPHPILTGMTEIYGATEFGAVGSRRHCRDPYTLLPHWKRVSLDGGEWGITRQKGLAMSLPDITDWLDERRFFPLRRKDHAVQVGGTNVFPARIADLLRGHPKVADCAVRLMRPEEGARLKAFVVPAKGVSAGPPLAGELKRWLAPRLDPASMPKSFTFGPRLPVTPSGKLADWSISGETSRT